MPSEGQRMSAVQIRLGDRPPAAEPLPLDMPTSGPLIDRFGRVHRDLRVSLTDRCSLRCTYCMPEQGNEWLARQSILTLDEIERVARIAAANGISTFRLTGGEPLLRRDLADIVARLSLLETDDGPVRIAMTTNAIGLDTRLAGLIDAGLNRLNISVDTIRRERFHELTRRDRLDDVLAGIRAAADSPLRPLKLNAVAMRGVNDDELVDLVQFAIDNDAQMRFIEQMPLDAGHTWERSQMVTREEILEKLSARWSLEPVPGRGGAPAESWRLDGTDHTVGVIASVTAPFCGACDRLRLTADGQLRNCLFSNREFDLVPLLRGSGSDADLEQLLRGCIWRKLPGHAINDPGFLQPDRGMNAIGG